MAYSYDADGDRTSMADWTGTTAYTYDGLDRLISVSFPGSKIVAYAYDPDGRRVSLTYPGGQAVEYGYDADERFSTVTDWLSHVTKYAYDPAGNLMSAQYPNKAGITFDYDAANRLTSVANAVVGPGLTFNYTLDPVGNRTKVTEAGIPTVYGYDALNELTNAQTGILKTSWTYDAVGNRLTETLPLAAIKYSYDASDRMLTAGTRTYTYDADGNEASVADALTHLKWTYTFNAANRLASVAGAGLTSSFVYDADGNRVSQSAGGLTQSYVNDIGAALPVVLQDAYNVGAPSSYVYGLNLIESLQGRADDFYQYDGLGSVIQLTDANGRPEWSYLYDPWGNSILPTPPSNPFLFAGQAFDAATGLYYLRARYYDPSIGRFLVRDQAPAILTLPTSANRYTYSLNSPTRFTDPTGLLTFAVGVSGTAALLSGIEANLLLVFDDKGNRALEVDIGPPVGIEASVGATVVLTNDSTIFQTEGQSFSVGGSLEAGASGAGYSLLFSGGNYNGVAANIGVGAGASVASFTTGSLLLVNSPLLDLFPSQPFLSWSEVQKLIDATNPGISSAK